MQLHSIGYQFIDSCFTCYYFHPFELYGERTENY